MGGEMMPAWDVAQRITLVFMWVSIIIIGCYDIYAALAKGPTATISFVLLVLAHRYPLLLLLVGILLGHLFWPQYFVRDQ